MSDPDSADTAPRRHAPEGPGSPSLLGLLAGLVAALVAYEVWALVEDAQAGNDGIAGLEVAGGAADARALGMEHVLVGFWVDAAVIVAYVLVLRWLVLWAGRHYRLESVRALRGTVGWAVVGAGVADVLEDVLLAVGITSGYATDGPVQVVWPLAAALAWAKFLVIAGAAGYGLVGLASRLTTPAKLRELLQAERRARTHEMRDVLAHESRPERRKLGIALSGGGIRSASISLGTLQALERPDLPGPPMGWWQADEVTAISGGANMAGAWSITRTARLAPQEGGPGASYDGRPDAWAWGTGGTPEVSPEEQHLLQNLGYLAARAPRGSEGDPTAPVQPGRAPAPTPAWRPSAYATILSGFLVNASLLLLCVWLVALPVGWAHGWLADHPGDCGSGDPRQRLSCLAGEPRLVGPTLVWLLVGLVGTVAWVAAGRFSNDRRLLTALRGASTAGWALGGLLLAGLVVFPYLMLWAGAVQAGRASLLSVLGALGSVGAVVRILRKPLAKYAPVLGGLVFAALVAFLTAYWAYGAATRPDLDGGPWSWAGPGWWAVGAVALLALWWAGSPEAWSLAPFYRGKLRQAYATHRVGDVAWPYRNDSGPDPTGKLYEPSFHDYLTRAMDPARGTPLTVCASATVSSRGVRTHYGIPAMSTTFTPVRVTMFVPENDEGVWRSWSCDTATMDRLCRRRDSSRLTTMLAVAISSAAVSPAMGRYRIGPTSMLLTFANVRLGVWMPNPRYAARVPAGVALPRIRLGYLFKEFFGLHDPSDLYVYLTDGGHWENTGLVELLRKGDFREIVCVDADPGPGEAVKSISEAIDLAALECGAEVNLDLDPLRAERGTSRAPSYSRRSVSVGFFATAAGEVGLLWYAKPALTRDMPSALLAHRETHPDFPRISTLDQFFDTSTFVAYRNLGRYNAHVIRTARAELLADMEAAVRQFADARSPVFADEYDAFCSLEQRGWAAVEIADLIARRTGTPGEQAWYFRRLLDCLRHEPPPQGDAETDITDRRVVVD